MRNRGLLADSGAVPGWDEIRERLISLHDCGVDLTPSEILAMAPRDRPAKLQKCRSQGHIIVDPPLTAEDLCQDGGRVAQVSVDVELGDAVRETPLDKRGRPAFPSGFAIDLRDPATLERYDELCPIRELGPDDVIRMKHGSFVRARSLRYYGLPGDLMALAEGRSKTGRIGMAVHLTAPKIDPGFFGRIVFELFLAGWAPLRLHPGDDIAQLIFLRVDGGIGKLYDELRAQSGLRQDRVNHLCAPGGDELLGRETSFLGVLAGAMEDSGLGLYPPWRDEMPL